MSLIYEIYQFIRNECTGNSSRNQELFDQEFGDLIQRSTFQPNLSELELWKRVWDKPFYQQTDAGVANLQCQRHKRVFEDLDLIRSEDWKYTGPVRGKEADYVAVGRHVSSALNGGFLHTSSAEPHVLRHPLRGTRLFYNRQLAVSFRSIYGAYHSYSALYKADERVGKGAHATQAIREQHRAQALPVINAITSVVGFGYTTACHISADLGLPFYKPDRWVCAFVLALPHVCAALSERKKCTIAELRRDTLNPGSKTSQTLIFAELDKLLDEFVEPLPGLGDVSGLVDGFQRLRAADWIVAHFGIGPEPAYGITDTPYELLKRPGTTLASSYPQLASLAQTIASFASPTS